MRGKGDGVIFSPFNSDETAGEIKRNHSAESKPIKRGMPATCNDACLKKKKSGGEINWVNKISSHLNTI